MKRAPIEPGAGPDRRTDFGSIDLAPTGGIAGRVVTPDEVLGEIGSFLAVILSLALLAQWLANALGAS